MEGTFLRIQDNEGEIGEGGHQGALTFRCFNFRNFVIFKSKECWHLPCKKWAQIHISKLGAPQPTPPPRPPPEICQRSGGELEGSQRFASFGCGQLDHQLVALDTHAPLAGSVV